MGARQFSTGKRTQNAVRISNFKDRYRGIKNKMCIWTHTFSRLSIFYTKIKNEQVISEV